MTLYFTNFLPWRRRAYRIRLRRVGILLCGLLLLASAIGIFRALPFASHRIEHHLLLEHSQRQTHALKEQVQQRQARQRDYELQRADAEKLRQQMADTLRWRRAITLVAQALPEQVWLTRMTMREQHLHIEGHTHSAAYLTELEQRLRRSPPLRFIRLKRVELLAEERVWRFQIALEADRDDEESL